MARRDGLDLARRDVHPTADDQVLDPARQHEAPALVEVPEVAGPHRSGGQAPGSRIDPFRQVVAHPGGARADQLARLTGRDRTALGVNDRDRRARERQPDAVGRLAERVRRRDRDREHLGHAVELIRANGRQRFPPPKEERGRHRLRREHQPAQARQSHVVDALEESRHERWDRVQRRRPTARLLDRGELEARQDLDGSAGQQGRQDLLGDRRKERQEGEHHVLRGER